MKRIIIVDDHGIVRDGIASVLATCEDVEVIGEAFDSESLFNLLMQSVPDIILLDITLPGISGIEITRIVKKEYPRIKILILSADGSRKNIFDAIEANADGFVLKNSGKETLYQAIKALGQGERFFEHTVSQTVINRLITKKYEISNFRDDLTEREIEIIRSLCRGLSHKQIAENTLISKRTVDTHVGNIMRKLNLHTKADLVRYAIRHGIFQT